MSKSFLLKTICIFFIAVAVAASTKASEGGASSAQEEEFGILDRIKNGQIDMNTIKFFFSKLIGLLIVCLSPIVVISQVLACYNNKGAKGISFESYCQICLCYIINMGYNFHNGYPISVYGESIPLYIGSFVILIQIWFYEGKQQGKEDGVTTKQ